MAIKTLTKRGRQILPQNKAKPVLKLATPVRAMPTFTFVINVEGDRVAWLGNTFLGDTFRPEDLKELLG
jgi:hypothetical protein